MATNKSLTATNTELNLIFSSPGVSSAVSDAFNDYSSLGSLNAVSSLLNVPLKLEALTADNPFAFTQQTLVETQASMDGTLYSGFIAGGMTVNLTASFIASSDSLSTLQQIAQIMLIQRESLKVEGTMIIPSLGKTFQLTNGHWINYQSIPSHATLLAPVTCVFRFASANQVAS